MYTHFRPTFVWREGERKGRFLVLDRRRDADLLRVGSPVQTAVVVAAVHVHLRRGAAIMSDHE